MWSGSFFQSGDPAICFCQYISLRTADIFFFFCLCFYLAMSGWLCGCCDSLRRRPPWTLRSLTLRAKTGVVTMERNDKDLTFWCLFFLFLLLSLFVSNLGNKRNTQKKKIQPIKNWFFFFFYVLLLGVFLFPQRASARGKSLGSWKRETTNTSTSEHVKHALGWRSERRWALSG